MSKDPGRIQIKKSRKQVHQIARAGGSEAAEFGGGEHGPTPGNKNWRRKKKSAHGVVADPRSLHRKNHVLYLQQSRDQYPLPPISPNHITPSQDDHAKYKLSNTAVSCRGEQT